MRYEAVAYTLRAPITWFFNTLTIRREMNWLKIIHRCFNLDRVLYSSHARREMSLEEFGSITDQEIYETICHGEVIKTYPDDTPYPSILIFGLTSAQRPLHIVCAYNREEDQTIIITAYQPDPNKWDDYRRRKR